eukprot:12409222-Karenia_brevis.AAC.1
MGCSPWPSEARKKQFACLRYEDDAIFISNTICEKCMHSIVRDVYSGKMKFEPSDDALCIHGDHRYNKFLDMHIAINFDTITLDIYHINLKMVLSGDPDLRVKYRYPPPLGTNADVLSRAHDVGLPIWNSVEMLACKPG